jgi:hypothetical protein
MTGNEERLTARLMELGPGQAAERAAAFDRNPLDPGRPITRAEMLLWFGEERPPFLFDLLFTSDVRMPVGLIRSAIRLLGEQLLRLKTDPDHP